MDKKIAVAGHVCLDIIPEIRNTPDINLIEPGKLLEIGPACLSTGGAVSNVGIALHKLGIKIRLLGKIGNDLFGRAILEQFNKVDDTLTENMVPAPGESTSYTIVVNPPGTDRIFWHHPGCNDTYTSDDIADEDLGGIGMFHFGYPPLMRQMFENEGEELLRLFQKVKAAGIITSLDMAYPDPNSRSGRVNWRKILKRVLPFVDIFFPSLDEICIMLDVESDGDISVDILNKLTGELLKFGAGIVGLKLGDRGFYLRTAGCERLGNVVDNAEPWFHREIYSPCYRVAVKGTTGAGDATIAGFLAAVIHDFTPEQAVNVAVAVGACSVESVDASSGIPSWDTLQKRTKSGWNKLPKAISFPGWTWNKVEQVACGSAKSGKK